MKKLMLITLLSSLISPFALASSSSAESGYTKNLICNALIREETARLAGEDLGAQLKSCRTGYFYVLGQNVYSVAVNAKYGQLVCRAEIYRKATGSKTLGVNIFDCKNIVRKPRMGGTN